MSNSSSNTLDIGQLLDFGPFSGLQRFVICLTALAIVLDGFDGQLIGYALPLIIEEWGITREAFAPAVAAGLLGMAAGMAGAGLIADRLGRRLVLIGSVALFGVATIAIGFSQGVMGIVILRFLAGLGIGGALPSASTMTAEFAPARSRTMAVTLTIVCYPLGGMLAGLFAGAILPTLGWRALFWVGGAIPVGFALFLLFSLPESPRFLAQQRTRWHELVKLLARIGRPVAPDTEFTDYVSQNAATAQKKGFAALFVPAYRRDTIALCTAFFMVVLSLYSAYSWLPLMLTTEGVNVGIASQALTAYNFGGVFGSLAVAWLMNRYGSRWPMIINCALACLAAVAMLGLDVQDNVGALIFGFGVHGMFVNSSQVALYALCAYVYSTEVRATGTATALAVGRFGGILSAFVGSAVITSGGSQGFLGLLAIGMAGGAIALFFVSRHIPPVGKRQAAAAAARAEAAEAATN